MFNRLKYDESLSTHVNTEILTGYNSMSRSIILNVEDQRVSQSRRSCTSRMTVSEPQALVSLPVAMSFCKPSRRWPDFRHVATIFRVHPTGSDSTAVAYCISSKLGFKGSAAVAITGSYPFSFSSLRIVCTAMFTTWGKHLSDKSRHSALYSTNKSWSQTECGYHAGKMEYQLRGVVLQGLPWLCHNLRHCQK